MVLEAQEILDLLVMVLEDKEVKDLLDLGEMPILLQEELEELEELEV